MKKIGAVQTCQAEKWRHRKSASSEMPLVSFSMNHAAIGQIYPVEQRTLLSAHTVPLIRSCDMAMKKIRIFIVEDHQIFREALISLALSYTIYLWQTHIHADQVESQFHDNALIHVGRHPLMLHQKVTITLGAFFNHATRITREEFHIFAGSLARASPSMQALEWIPKVTAAERLEYEKEAGKMFPGFRFSEMNEQGDLVTASSSMGSCWQFVTLTGCLSAPLHNWIFPGSMCGFTVRLPECRSNCYTRIPVNLPASSRPEPASRADNRYGRLSMENHHSSRSNNGYSVSTWQIYCLAIAVVPSVGR